MKNKGALLFAIDLCAAGLMGGLIVTGFVLQWVLPHGGGPGSGGGRHGGRMRDAEFLGLARHDWGDVHFWVSVAFVVAIVVHLLLHVGWLRASFAKHVFGARRARAATT